MAVWNLKAMVMRMPLQTFDFTKATSGGRVVRCGATTTTTICRRDGVLERSFEAEADVGRVECSGKGCRPVYEEGEDEEEASTSNYMTTAMAWDWLCPELQIKVQPKQQRLPTMNRTFQGAMQGVSHDSQHLSAFAAFSWKSLGDVEKAEELYQEALDHASPDDTDVLASYANFLWQCDQ